MNIWLKSLCFLLLVLTATYFFYRPNMPQREDSPKYYLVDVTYQGGVYDDDHRFSMMMTGEEVFGVWPWNILHEDQGAIYIGGYGSSGGYGYGFMELSISCEVTKTEYDKFRKKLDSVASESLRKGFCFQYYFTGSEKLPKGYCFEDELKERDLRQLHKETKGIKGEYYLVATHFRPGGETISDRYTFQMMLKDEELKAWQKYKPWRPTNETEDGYYNYEEDYPYVRVICEVTKQEYNKFHKHLNGFKQHQRYVMNRIKDVLSSNE